MTEYGSGGSLTVTMDGPYGGSGGVANKLTMIHADASSWKGGTSPYSQVVAVEGISINSKVDIDLSVDQLELFYNQKIAFTAENNNGTVTLFAVGDKPGADCDFQATVSDIVAIGATDGSVIRGNTVTTISPRTDLNQTDPEKADYLKGREGIINMIKTAQATLSTSKWVSKVQTVNVAGILADASKQAIVSVSDPDSLETYLDCNIRLTGNGEGTLTYTCDEVPKTNVKVNVLILTKGGV